MGIIGVVAAMTIPTLIANTNSAKFRSQFKKSLSTLNQAGLMAQAQYDINYGATDACTDANDSTSLSTFCSIFNGTLSGHSISDTAPDGYAPADISGVITNPYYLTMADGSMVIFSKDAAGCTLPIGSEITEVEGANCLGIIDVNGATLPNKLVSCQDTTGSESVPDLGGLIGNPSTNPVNPNFPRLLISLIPIETGTCTVPNDTSHMTDIYPVVFHDATVEPATPAARTVLTTAK